MLASEVRAIPDILANAEEELAATTVALVDVELLVFVEGHDHVFHIDRATEELDTVVGIVEDLDVLDRRSTTHSTKGKTIDLLILLELETTVLDGDIFEDT